MHLRKYRYRVSGDYPLTKEQLHFRMSWTLHVLSHLLDRLSCISQIWHLHANRLKGRKIPQSCLTCCRAFEFSIKWIKRNWTVLTPILERGVSIYLIVFMFTLLHLHFEKLAHATREISGSIPVYIYVTVYRFIDYWYYK